MFEWTSTRANALVDPSLHVWGPWVVMYLFLGGLVAGVMVLAAARRLLHPETPASRALALVPWAAPILLTIGMLCLWFDLENRFNAWRFYLILRPATPMSWGAWILILVYPVSILFAWNGTPESMRERWLARLSWLRHSARLASASLRHAAGLARFELVLGGLLGIYTGILLGAMAARPLWNSALLGPLFLVSGVSTGAAFLLLLELWPRERMELARIDTALLGLELGLIGLWLAMLASGDRSAQAAARLLCGGDWTAAFWTLVVALGLVTPLVAAGLERRHGALPGRAAAVLVLLGGLALRWIVVGAGQHAAASVAMAWR